MNIIYFLNPLLVSTRHSIAEETFQASVYVYTVPYSIVSIIGVEE